MDRPTYIKTYLKEYRERHKCVNLAIPMAEYKKLEKAALHEGLTPARLLLRIGLSQLDQSVYVPLGIAAEIRSVRLLIRNIANNLNQIAHHTNAVRKAADEKAVFAELERLERAVADYTTGRLQERHDHQVHEP